MIFDGMKQCGDCKRIKESTSFNKNSSTKDGLNRCCKVCSRKFGKNHYNKNKRYYIDKKRRLSNEIEETIRFLKSETPCNDCGKKYPYYCMDFDHRDSTTKLFCVADRNSWNGSKKKVFVEVDKCDVVCAVCHRIRTYKRMMGTY